MSFSVRGAPGTAASKVAKVLAWSTMISSAYWACPWICNGGMLRAAVPGWSGAAQPGGNGSRAATIALLSDL